MSQMGKSCFGEIVPLCSQKGPQKQGNGSFDDLSTDIFHGRLIQHDSLTGA